MEQKDLPTYLLTYDHGGYILWGRTFQGTTRQRNRLAGKIPSFKLGLDNESFAYDQYAETQPEIIAFVRRNCRRLLADLRLVHPRMGNRSLYLSTKNPMYANSLMRFGPI